MVKPDPAPEAKMIPGADPRQLFGEQVTVAIINSRLSQAAIADILGVAQQSVSAWATGRAIPEFGTLEQLAELLDVDPKPWEALKMQSMTAVKRNRDGKSIDEMRRRAKEQPAALSGKIERLTLRQRQMIEEFVDELLGGKER